MICYPPKGGLANLLELLLYELDVSLQFLYAVVRHDEERIVDAADGKRYLRRYDALHLYVGYHKNREHAIVEVKDITYRKEDNAVLYHLGVVLEHIRPTL